MEYVDILDENGNQTGEIASKKEAHQKGLWHKAVHIWAINDKQELLLQRISSQKVYSNKWGSSAAGHISTGEDSETAVIRELSEEIGLELEEKDFEYLFTAILRQNDGTIINNEYNDIYLVHINVDINNLKLQKEEVAEVKFMHYKELEELVNNRHEDILMKYEEYKRLFEVLHERYDK